jgi:hypothetical protein
LYICKYDKNGVLSYMCVFIIHMHDMRYEYVWSFLNVFVHVCTYFRARPPDPGEGGEVEAVGFFVDKEVLCCAPLREGTKTTTITLYINYNLWVMKSISIRNQPERYKYSNTLYFVLQIYIENALTGTGLCLSYVKQYRG